MSEQKDVPPHDDAGDDEPDDPDCCAHGIGFDTDCEDCSWPVGRDT